MKKVTNWFNKKKKQVIANGIDKDALPEEPRDIPRYVPKQRNLYNNFRPDDCCSANCKTVSNVSNGIATEMREESLTVGNRTELNLPTAQEHVEVTGQQISSNSIEEMPRLPDVRTTTKTDIPSLRPADTLMIDSADNMNRSNSLNDMAVQESDQIHDLSSDLISKKIHDNKKKGGNTYVITISNSTHFHIGTQKTIIYPGTEENGGKKEITFPNITNRKFVELDENQLLDMKDKLSKDDLANISISVSERWEELARNLGLEESTILELEEMNMDDYNLIVHDILQRYLEKYPNTSVGFMVNILKKCNEYEAIRKLTEKR